MEYHPRPKSKESKEGDKFLVLLEKCKRVYKYSNRARQQWREHLTLQLIGKVDDELRHLKTIRQGFLLLEEELHLLI